jgi:GNAT superfamily N-acetyltransferase
VVRSEVVVRQAGPREFERVGELVCALLKELYPDAAYERSAFVDTARTLLEGSEGVWSFLATTPDDRAVGVVTLNECAAIYAGGRFGEISELYVVPGFRSKAVGALLIEAAVAFGRERGWPDVEVGAPRVPTWQRTVDFYLRHGFEEVGPRLNLTLPGAE